MSKSHVALAIGHLEAVAATREHLQDLYATMRRSSLHDTTRSNVGAQVAEAHQAIGYGLKAASIHADIAQAIALERANELAGDDYPKFAEAAFTVSEGGRS